MLLSPPIVIFTFLLSSWINKLQKVKSIQCLSVKNPTAPLESKTRRKPKKLPKHIKFLHRMFWLVPPRFYSDIWLVLIFMAQKIIWQNTIAFSLPPIFCRNFTQWLNVIGHTEKHDFWNSSVVSVKEAKRLRGQCFCELKLSSCTFIVTFRKSEKICIFFCTQNHMSITLGWHLNVL